jgi:molecular chaperone DnaJ
VAVQREWLETDYYAVLGVPPSASDKEVTSAYRKLAKKFHPDTNAGDAASESRFKEISAAYEVLGDKDKRKEYDEVRAMQASGMGGFGRPTRGGGGPRIDDLGGLGDLFGGLFGRSRGGAPAGGPGRRGAGPRPGADLDAELHLSFLDAVRGATSTVRVRAESTCSTCGGNGARPGTQPVRCTECGGVGTIAVDQGPFGFSQTCPRCGGAGVTIEQPCSTCSGSGIEVRTNEIKVRVPAGVADGQRIRVAGKGGAGLRGGPPGDLFVTVHVAPHELFERRGRDLVVKVPVTYWEAALGTEVRVPTLDDPVRIRVPGGTQPGKTLRVRGRGIVDGHGRAGDLLAVIDLVVPTELSAAERKATERLAAASTFRPRAGLDARTGTVADGPAGDGPDDDHQHDPERGPEPAPAGA